jgi:hypothetical protein
MKKYLMCFILFSFFVSGSLIAQTPKFSIGGGGFLTHYITAGGDIDFAFLLYHDEDAFDMRNHFVLRHAGIQNNGGFLSFSEKLTFAYFVESKFRLYWFLEGGVGLWGNNGKNWLEMPLSYNAGIGVGTELFLWDKFCIYFETGDLNYLLGEDWSIGIVLLMGWKYYF